MGLAAAQAPLWSVSSSQVNDRFGWSLVFALRVGPEERMMTEEFGAEYEAYMARTKRLVPGIW
jgi:protein-S-isoprenylcysteine O-methyltransferase Ste14